MDAPIEKLENTDVLVGPPHLRIRLFWFTTDSPINVCFMKVVHHLAVELAQAWAHDDGKLTRARDDLAAVLKASRAQWNVIIGRHIFPVTQADPVRPIVPQKRPAENSVVERTRIVTDGQPGILFLTTVSVPALQVGAAEMNLQLRAMAQRVEEVARDAGVQNRTPVIKMQVIFKNE
ncbi:uncharacterized protein ARMOST_15078 [Armillaria ostoyae]|uniref:Uncharacterized protein n=1 Tax=Armillaria ostoyae TaxID=47428 RepID=A0A284RSD6_ARMOS|nr:uncharacterized protein ARMOST_15078 [Armillaria ostoyae]